MGAQSDLGVELDIKREEDAGEIERWQGGHINIAGPIVIGEDCWLNWYSCHVQ